MSAIVGLAALALPRIVAHDLGLTGAGSAVNTLLSVLPLAAWIVAVLGVRSERPLLAGLAIGVAYGVILLVAHQVMWDQAFDGDPPRLGDNLEGRLPGPVEQAVIRGFASISSLVTGTLIGAVVGVVAAVLDWVRRQLTAHGDESGLPRQQ